MYAGVYYDAPVSRVLRRWRGEVVYSPGLDVYRRDLGGVVRREDSQLDRPAPGRWLEDGCNVILPRSTINERCMSGQPE